MSLIDFYVKRLLQRKAEHAALNDPDSGLQQKRQALFRGVIDAYNTLTKAKVCPPTGGSSVYGATSLLVTDDQQHTIQLTVTTDPANLRIHIFVSQGLKQIYVSVEDANRYLAEWCADHEPLD